MHVANAHGHAAPDAPTSVGSPMTGLACFNCSCVHSTRLAVSTEAKSTGLQYQRHGPQVVHLLQERLQNLRASLGNGKQAHSSLDKQQDDVITQGASRTVPLSELEGMCTLLGLHLTTLEASQQPLVRMCRSAPASGEDYSDDVQHARIRQRPM